MWCRLYSHIHACGSNSKGCTRQLDAAYIYFSADAPIVNVDRSAPKVTVGTATGQSHQSQVTGELNLPKIPSGFPVTGHIMPGFRHTLIGVGPLCDADCTFTFTRVARSARAIL